MILYFYWGLGIGDWGLGIGDWGLGPIPKPNPQSPIPNPQSPIKDESYYFNIFKIITKFSLTKNKFINELPNICLNI